MVDYACGRERKAMSAKNNTCVKIFFGKIRCGFVLISKMKELQPYMGKGRYLILQTAV